MALTMVGWVSEVFVWTDARRACPRGVIGSTMGAYPRGTGSNPVEGNGHFFRTCCQLYLSSFPDTYKHTHVLNPFILSLFLSEKEEKILTFLFWEWERARVGIEPTTAAPCQPDRPGVSRSDHSINTKISASWRALGQRFSFCRQNFCSIS